MKFTLNRGRMPGPSRSTRAYLVTLIVGLILSSPVAFAQEKWVKLTPPPRTCGGSRGQRA